MEVGMERIGIHADERGLVFEPLAAHDLSKQQNVHVVLTQPGYIRGNHFHRRATEIVTVLGPALVRFRAGSAVEEVAIPHGGAMRFTFPPGVAHAIQNTGDESNFLVAFTDTIHDRDAPDAVRDILIEV